MKDPFLHKLQTVNTRKKLLDEAQLREWYQEIYPKSQDSNFFWSLYELKERKILQELEKGAYQFMQLYKPSLSGPLLDIFLDLKKVYDLGRACFWSSTWFNSFSTHQATQGFLVIEMEKESTESVFDYLKDSGHNRVYLLLHKQDEALLERYVFEQDGSIIIQRAINKAPLQKMPVDEGQVPVPYLEKMLVDLFIDKHLLMAYQGAEMDRIYESAIQEYVLDYKKLFSYAKRRGKIQEIQEYLYDNFAEQIQ